MPATTAVRKVRSPWFWGLFGHNSPSTLQDTCPGTARRVVVAADVEAVVDLAAVGERATTVGRRVGGASFAARCRPHVPRVPVGRWRRTRWRLRRRW